MSEETSSEQKMSQQEKGHKGMSHGPTPQEGGRRGAEARWAKARQKGEEVGVEEGYAEQQGEETRTSRAGGSYGEEQEEHHPMSPQERGKKGISHGMSPHERGLRGAEARWGRKFHEGEEGSKTESRE
jgi:hypothetical protein